MASDVTLRELANRHGSDKGDQVGCKNNYTALYDPLFFARRFDRIRLLELGLAIGGPEGGGPVERKVFAPSIAMWLEYFPNAEIYGFDISDFSHLRNPRFHFIRGDLGAEADLARLAASAPAFDIIIDDGSHASYHQQLALAHLFPRLAPGGLYVIESLHWQPPISGTSLPAVPRTADLLQDTFGAGKFSGSAALPENQLRSIATELQSCSLLPSVPADGPKHKIALLQKKSDVAASHPIRSPVRSFDLFDTLVARRCHEPAVVFQVMEHRGNMKGFVPYRRAAEARLYGRSYTLADIYQQLASDAGLDAELANRLMNLEIEIEREMLFPIAEVCAAVRHGDIVVSDMYLPPEFLQDLVQRVCAVPAARLYVSAEGKKTGQIWPVIRREFEVAEHLGDNPNTDIASAQAAGIPARLVTIAHRTRVEADLADAGYTPLSNVIREARLRTWSADSNERAVQLLQVQTNFPLLFVATLHLANLAAEYGWRRVLFSGRDCYLWNELYASLAPLLGDVPAGCYFHSSRLPRVHPSEDYLRYFAALRGEHPAVAVDLCGTGWSLNRLIERAPGPKTDIFLVHHQDDPELRAYYERQADIAARIEPLSCVRRMVLKGENEVLEELNRAPFRLLLDVEAGSAGFRPIFDATLEPPGAVAILRIHHTAFRGALALLYGMAPDALADMRKSNHAEMVVRLYRDMEGQMQTVAHSFPYKWQEEKAFRAKIESARPKAVA